MGNLVTQYEGSKAQAGQVRIARRARAALEDGWQLEPVGPLNLKWLTQPVTASLLKGPPN
jgi:class 3 adenylate cyclase